MISVTCRYTQDVSDFFSPYLLAVYVSEIFMICSNTYVLIENQVDFSIVLRMMIAYPILLTELAVLSVVGQLVSDEVRPATQIWLL